MLSICLKSEKFRTSRDASMHFGVIERLENDKSDKNVLKVSGLKWEITIFLHKWLRPFYT